MEEVELKDLFKYKTKVEITNNSGKIVRTLWQRILGDSDLQLCYKLARLSSAKKRIELRTKGSEAYEADIAGVPVLNSTDECKQIIKMSKASEIMSEAYAVIDKDDPPELEEVTDEPDGPTLEDQEKLDGLIDEVNTEYKKKVQDYINDKNQALQSELDNLSDEELYERTRFEMSNILAFDDFQKVLTAQKIFRGTYRDAKCSIRAYKTLEEFIESSTNLKSQLIDSYNNLELSPDDVKN